MVSLGHAHPVVADAVAAQARTLSHVSNLYGNQLGPEVALTIDRLINGGTGTGRRAGVLHQLGRRGQRVRPEAGPPLGRGRPACRHQRRQLVPREDPGHPDRHRATREARAVPTAARRLRARPLRRRGRARSGADADTVAAVLLEPLQGEGGVNVPSSDYLGAVRALCTERDALLMLDEVQTGLGRTGHWFAFQAQGLAPDVVTMAKALGNGMPVGACWARAEVAAAFGPGDHGSTFGGQPLALAAARATLAVMEAEDVCGRAQRAGTRLAAGLARLPGVVSVRGAGLLLAAELAQPVAGEVTEAALAHGLLVNAVRPDAVRVAPPLLVSDGEIDAALDILAAALGDVLSEASTGASTGTSTCASTGTPAGPGRPGG